ncbi:MAG: PSD1 and planctomycete cytochrome C domain-containing protein [Fuerstiella sp.]|nr:PSD1 and planctomycete cytochrome C domain-containing protein [Fuerstiella sp.]
MDDRNRQIQIDGTLIVFGLYFLLFAVPAAVTAEEPRFERDIVPILDTKCVRCHGGKKRAGELDLSSMGAIRRGGASGNVVTEGRPDESLLLRRIHDDEMPPENEPKLTAAEVTLIHDWIAAGVPADDQTRSDSPESATSVISSSDREFWSFQRLKRPPVPEVNGLPQTPIDSFIMEHLQRHHLAVSGESEPRRLVRRLYFDLLGLPPTPAQLDAFLSDTEPNAYERLVDRLLASKHFGERWARHWLDTVGYTDTVSYDGDTNFIPGFIKGRWRYRDYVIDSLNEDKPYDEFLKEQIAGDELVDWREDASFDANVISTLAATGFWRNSEDRSGAAKELVYKWSLLHDTMQTFGTSVLGLTLRCARCHSHKHEPIPQEDYYRILSLITPAFNIQDWKSPEERALPALSAAEKRQIDAHNAKINKQTEELTRQVTELRDACRKCLREQNFGRIPVKVRKAVRAAFEIEVQARTPEQQTLVQQYTEQLSVTEEALELALSDAEKKTIADLKTKSTELKTRLRTHGWIQAVYDVGQPPAAYLLKRGDYTRRGREVTPGFLSVLAEPGRKPEFKRLKASSGRRTALARWLTEPTTPAAGLISRVFVNRIWQHLTGVGLVASSENLGMSGSRPTHPELLEWLAAEFVDGDWQTKPVIRQIVTSSVYRQTSRPDIQPPTTQGSYVNPLDVDPDNRLLWHSRLRRLESEAIRDSMLIAAGVFDATAGGPPVPLRYRKDGLAAFDVEKFPSPTAGWRRSVYLFQRRVYHLTLMTVFDQPSVAGPTCRRASSAVALQSLTLLNDDLALDLAEQFGKRVYQLAGNSLELQINTAFLLALGRSPQSEEREWSKQLLNQQLQLYKTESQSGSEPTNAEPATQKALMHLGRVLFNSTEFLYIE